jgi:hypothetical protein
MALAQLLLFMAVQAMRSHTMRTTKIQTAEKQIARFLTFFFLLLIATRESRAQTEPLSTSPTSIQHRRKVVVSIAYRKLALLEDGEVKKVYPIAVGAAKTPSPEGTFEIRTRLVKPTYYHPGKVIPAGADNPLGTRWLGLSTKGYGIHGTNVESSIGKAASHGCIRMHRKDLEELFAAVQVGDQVEIRSEIDEEVAGIFGELPGTTTTTDSATTLAANGQE